MKDKNDNGFVVMVNSILGVIDVDGNVEVHWVEGSPVNSSLTTFYRSYTDENGAHRIDGSFADIDQANEYMYKLVGQAVQDMLRKGWVDIKVNKTKTGRSKPNVLVSVYGKTLDGTRGWRQTYSVNKDYRQRRSK